jgi:hypothetical protein
MRYLGDVPAEPFLAILEVVGRSAPAQQSDPSAIHFGHIPDLFTNQGVALEVVMLFHQLAETLPLQGVVGCKQAELDVVEDLLLGQGGHAETGSGHAPVCPTGRKMSSDLSLNAGFQLFDRLKKSAVFGPMVDVFVEGDVHGAIIEPVTAFVEGKEAGRGLAVRGGDAS